MMHKLFIKRSHLVYLGQVILLAAVYLATAKVGVEANAIQKFASILWPPSGIALAALLVFGLRLWPGIFIGAVLINCSVGVPLATAAGIGIGNCLEALMGAFLCSRPPGFHLSLDRFQDVRRLFIRSAFFSTMISASIGITSIYLSAMVTTEEINQTWLRWWLGNVMGVLTVAPLVLVFASDRPSDGTRRPGRRLIEKFALAASLVGTNLLLFTGVFGPSLTAQLKGPFIFPFLLWAAVRFGVKGAVLASFVTSSIAIWATANGSGPFEANAAGDHLFQLTFFVMIVAATNLVIASIVTERENERADLAKSKQDLLRAKEEAEAANAAKTAFLANMSHEIRTPLGAVLGFAEILGTEMSATERASSIDAVKRNGRILSNLIDDILDLSKVEAGKLEVEKVEVAVEEIVHDLSSFLTLKAAEKNLKTSVVVAEDLPSHIQTDPLRFRQILLNIVGNAIKFTDRGGVTLYFHFLTDPPDSPKLACTVKDTGAGVPMAQKQRIFEPFTQADVSTTRRFGGTGLGLILSRQLARALGGDVELTESAPGQGSTFTITIDPGKARWKETGDQASKTQTPEIVESARNWKGLKVLLVEDNFDNQFLICRILNIRGIHVETATDGREGINKALSGDYDLILMDVQMPVMDGFEATKTLRAQGYNRPIVALTAHAMKEDRQRCLAHGFNEYLSKPIDHGALWTVLARYTPLSEKAQDLTPNPAPIL